MHKPGTALKGIPAFPTELLRPLVDRFSISTAEEFVSMSAHNRESLRKALEVETDLLDLALATARQAIPPEIAQALEDKGGEKYSKGALLGNSPMKETGLDKHLKKE